MSKALQAIYQAMYIGDGGTNWSDITEEQYHAYTTRGDYHTRKLFLEEPKEDAPPSIVDLVTDVGYDNITFQLLDSSLSDMRALKRANKYTFESDVGFDLNGPEKMGLVLWIDRDVYNNSFKKLTGK